MRSSRRLAVAVLATVALISPFIAGAATPANASVVHTQGEEPPAFSTAGITALNVSIENSEFAKRLGASSDVAYVGSAVTAVLETESEPVSVRFRWTTSQGNPHLDPFSDGVGASTVVTDVYYAEQRYLDAEVTFADGTVSYAKTAYSVDELQLPSGTYSLPSDAVIRPGTSFTASYRAPEGFADLLTPSTGWFVGRSNLSTLGKKPIARDAQAIQIQPTMAGQRLYGKSSYGYIQGTKGPVQAERSWPISTDPVVSPSVSLAPASSTAVISAKVGPIEANAGVLQTAWFINGRMVQDFTQDFGTTLSGVQLLPGTRVEARVRLVFADGTVTEPSASRPITLTTPVFASPKVTISGTAQVGRKLTLHQGLGAVPPKVSKSYVWLRNGTPIRGAVGASYTVSAADAGKRVSGRIVFKPSDRAAQWSTSAQTKSIALAVTAANGVRITGTSRPGKTLKAVTGKLWTPGTKFTYQWYRNGKAIKGATRASYKLTKADASKKIHVVAKGTQPGFTTGKSESSRMRISAR